MIARGQFRGAGWSLRAAIVGLALLAGAAHSATITIVNGDAAGEGFNDATGASPVGNNPGTTIGAQRLFVFQHAANIWGGLLPSAVEIRVNATFDPLSCTTNSGVLGSAGPAQLFKSFPNAPLANSWYHVALANRLAGSDLSAMNDINAHFNSSVGLPACLSVGWYYGVDGNEGNQIELLPVVLHELGHGLGFSTTTNGQNGQLASGFPHVFDHYLFDNTTGLHWDQMNDAQRTTSALACTKLAWDGPSVVGQAPSRLGPKPILHVNSPAPIAGDYSVGLADFGPALDPTGVTGVVVLANDGVGTVTNACEPLVNAAAMNGKIALVDRGACGFGIKVKNAQNAGAIAVIVADSIPGCPPIGLSAIDPTITIPSVRITQADGATLKANLGLGVNVTLRTNPSQLAGADATGRVLMYTPNPYQSGSSVSHWDTSAEPSLLMEPASTVGLSSDPDLTVAQFADIGWFQGLLAVGRSAPQGPRLSESRPNPTPAATTIEYSLPRDENVELSIYDLTGRRVAKLADGRMSAGSHTVQWNGKDHAGRLVPAGVYVYRLDAPDVRETRHLVVVR